MIGEKWKELKDELKKKKEATKNSEIERLCRQLKEAYDIYLQTLTALREAESQLNAVRLRNLSKRIAGEKEEEIESYRKKAEELEKALREAAGVVRFLETQAKAADPKFFDFL